MWRIEAVSPGRLSLGVTSLCANDFPLWYGRVPAGTIQRTEARVLRPGEWYYVGLDEQYAGTVSIDQGLQSGLAAVRRDAP